jgi:hypothetical protein
MSRSRHAAACAGGVTHTWIDDDEEPLEEGGGVMQPEANVPQWSHARKRVSS